MEPGTKNQEHPNSPKRIWVINPFDQLPNETDVPLRYWTLCRMLAEQGHEVIWWSSGFSHLTKSKRLPCPPTEGFSIRLVPTGAYKKNISFRRLLNHRRFAMNFLKSANEALSSGSLEKPDRIVVSMPPLGVAEKAFQLRQKFGCKVILDIQDAWPETFYRAISRAVPSLLRSAIFIPLHRNARAAYRGADRLTGVGKTYLDLAASYGATAEQHLCYLGAALETKPIGEVTAGNGLNIAYLGAMESGYDLRTVIEFCAQWKSEKQKPLRLHMAGAGSQRDDLETFGKSLGLSDQEIVWHGYLQKAQIHELLEHANLALVPNRTSSLVACPNKACEYAAAGLPIISCLKGEFEELVKEWEAGLTYEEGGVDSLYSIIQQYASEPGLISRHSANARQMAETLFDRTKTYKALAKFIEG